MTEDRCLDCEQPRQTLINHPGRQLCFQPWLVSATLLSQETTEANGWEERRVPVGEMAGTESAASQQVAQPSLAVPTKVVESGVVLGE